MTSRVLMTADTVGGVFTYAVDLSRALGDLGVEVVLATMGRLPSEDQRARIAALRNVRLFASDFALEWMPDPWDDVRRAADWLLELEVRESPDVVHLNGYAHGAAPFRAPTLVVGHSCVLSWWRAVHGCDAPANAWSTYARHVVEGLREAGVVVAPTAAMMHALETHYGPLGPRRVIANGRATARFREATKEPFVFCAGRIWDEAKNVAALAAVADRLPWKVKIAGEVGARAFEARGCELLGVLDEGAIADVLSRAAIYALPARYEPFGLSAVEAAFSGCALVLGDLESLREVWGDAALYVPPNDLDALAHGIELLAADPLRRAWLASRAKARAREYSAARMARHYLAAYDEVTRRLAFAEAR